MFKGGYEVAKNSLMTNSIHSVNFLVGDYDGYYHSLNMKEKEVENNLMDKSFIKDEIDYRGSVKRIKHEKEQHLQNEITKIQMNMDSLQKISDVVHYLKELIKNDKENDLPSFSDLFKETKETLSQISEEIKNRNILEKLDETFSDIVGRYFGDDKFLIGNEKGNSDDFPNNGDSDSTNENNPMNPDNEEYQDEQQNNDSHNNENHNNNDISLDNGDIDNDNQSENGIGNEAPNTNNGNLDSTEENHSSNELKDKYIVDYEELQNLIQKEILEPINQWKQELMEKQEKIIEQLLDNQQQFLRAMQMKSYKEMMLELRVKMLEEANHFLVHQFRWNQKQQLIQLLM
jgi:hypothetical protein